LHKIITSVMKLIARRGELVEEEGLTTMSVSDSESVEARVLRPLQAAACSYRIAFFSRGSGPKPPAAEIIALAHKQSQLRRVWRCPSPGGSAGACSG
jgi:hypothetical protein